MTQKSQEQVLTECRGDGWMTSPEADPGTWRRHICHHLGSTLGLAGDPGSDVCGGLAHIRLIIPSAWPRLLREGEGEKNQETKRLIPNRKQEPVIPGESGF